MMTFSSEILNQFTSSTDRIVQSPFYWYNEEGNGNLEIKRNAFKSLFITEL